MHGLQNFVAYCQCTNVDTSEAMTQRNSLPEPGEKAYMLTFHASKRFQEDVIFVYKYIHFLINFL